jgi:hypothetical protein
VVADTSKATPESHPAEAARPPRSSESASPGQRVIKPFRSCSAVVHCKFNARLTVTKPTGSVAFMADEILAGDIEVGDLIALSAGTEDLLVRAVRLGRGGFIVSVSPAGDPSSSSVSQVTLTAGTQLLRRGKARAFEPPLQPPSRDTAARLAIPGSFAGS